MAEQTVEHLPSSAVHSHRSTNNGSRHHTLVLNPFQRIQVERFRLNYLLCCRGNKRPPPSLRCTGFKALKEDQRIAMISRTETVVLEQAIENKKKYLKVMEKYICQNKKEYPPLSKIQRKRWKKHFKKKLEFYKEKEAGEWLMWPKKFIKESEHQKGKKKKTRTHRNIKRK